ncbi:hypothetical protein ES703_82280 [subsurface metagenome]
MDESKKPEVKYQPEYYIDDLANLLGLFMEKIKIIDEIEFTLKQKATISGMMLGFANVFQSITKKLREWGFVE